MRGQFSFSTQPEFPDEESPAIRISQGTHPLLHLARQPVPNDVHLGSQEYFRQSYLEGPNMGGKSTLLRMVGILVVMAHLGCRVPCKGMALPCIDQIFTRIGSSDYLSHLKSTFYIELEQILRICQNSTSSSLVLIDEIGKGTDFRDGDALALSILGFLNQEKRPYLIVSSHQTSLKQMILSNKNLQFNFMVMEYSSPEE